MRARPEGIKEGASLDAKGTYRGQGAYQVVDSAPGERLLGSGGLTTRQANCSFRFVPLLKSTQHPNSPLSPLTFPLLQANPASASRP